MPGIASARFCLRLCATAAWEQINRVPSTELFHAIKSVAFPSVPRISPISKRDREIAARLCLLRKAKKCSRSYLAIRSGLDAQGIVRIELGRVPLKYGTATRILWALDCNPVWAATGKGAQKPFVFLPEPAALGVSENAAYSEVFDKHLAHVLDVEKGDASDSNSTPGIRYSSAMLLHCFIEERMCEVPDGRVQELTGGIQAYALNLMDKWPKDDAQKIFGRRVWFAKLNDGERRSVAGTGKKSALDENTEIRNSTSAMKLTLSALLDEVRKLTQPVGMKAKLAAALGVPPTRVSEWLSGKHDPSGEVTLQLLNWVERQKRKK